MDVTVPEVLSVIENQLSFSIISIVLAIFIRRMLQNRKFCNDIALIEVCTKVFAVH